MPVVSAVRGIGERFVYILRSDSDPNRHYVGVTGDVDERPAWHNGGPCGFTLQHRPWRVIVSMEFPDEQSAVRFEKYLKSGSGRAFTKRHFGLTPNPERPIPNAVDFGSTTMPSSSSVEGRPTDGTDHD